MVPVISRRRPSSASSQPGRGGVTRSSGLVTTPRDTLARTQRSSTVTCSTRSATSHSGQLGTRAPGPVSATASCSAGPSSRRAASQKSFVACSLLIAVLPVPRRPPPRRPCGTELRVNVVPDVSAEHPIAASPESDISLRTCTTLRLGGPAGALTTAFESAEAIETVRIGEPLLILAGGSNVGIGDAGFPGTVMLLRTTGIRVVGSDRGHVTIRVAAGEPWDGLVSRTVAEGWSGVECLSGIPGSAGATPIQNVGAYGQEVAETIVAVHVYDRDRDEVRVMTPAECGFAYRNSVFKHSARWLVLDVDFRLARSDRSMPIRYAELARRLGVDVGDRVSLERA